MNGYKKDRHTPLDYLRVRDTAFNSAWFVFFRTPAPGVNPRTIQTETTEAPPPDRLSALVARFARPVGSNN